MSFFTLYVGPFPLTREIRKGLSENWKIPRWGDEWYVHLGPRVMLEDEGELIPGIRVDWELPEAVFDGFQGAWGVRSIASPYLYCHLVLEGNAVPRGTVTSASPSQPCPQSGPHEPDSCSAPPPSSGPACHPS